MVKTLPKGRRRRVDGWSLSPSEGGKEGWIWRKLYLKGGEEGWFAGPCLSLSRGEKGLIW